MQSKQLVQRVSPCPSQPPVQVGWHLVHLVRPKLVFPLPYVWLKKGCGQPPTYQLPEKIG